MVIRYFLVSVISGLLFGVMDGVINANPLAKRLFEVYQPIARSKLNIQAGIIIDLMYGFALAGLFLLFNKSLPGFGLLKGISFGLIVWVLRVVMGVASQWMVFNIPLATLGYNLLTGLAEMLVLGLLYGLTLKPASL